MKENNGRFNMMSILGASLSIFLLVGMTFSQSAFSVTKKITKAEYQKILQERKLAKKRKTALRNKITKEEYQKVLKQRQLAKKKATKKNRKKPSKKIAKKKSSKKYKKKYSKVKSGKSKKLKLSSQAAVSTKASTKKKRKKNKKKKSGKTTAKVEAVKPEEKSPWGFSYVYWGNVATNDFAEQTGKIGGVHIFTAGYKTASGMKLSIKPTFSIGYDLEFGAAESKMGDIILEASKGKLLNLGGFDLSAKGRYYIPTGESSRKSGSNGQLRGDLKLGRSFDKLGVYYSLSNRYYLQSNRAVADFDVFDRVVKAKPQTGLRFVNEVGASYGVTDAITLESSLGIDHAFKYDDPGLGVVNPPNSTSFDISLGASFSLTSHLNMSFYYGQSHGLSGDDVKPFALFNGDETSYTLVLVIH